MLGIAEGFGNGAEGFIWNPYVKAYRAVTFVVPPVVAWLVTTYASSRPFHYGSKTMSSFVWIDIPPKSLECPCTTTTSESTFRWVTCAA